MGSGASAVDTTKLTEASPEELAEAIRGVGPENLKKLQDAFREGGAAEAKKEEPAAKEEENKEEFAATEEEKQESPATAEAKEEEKKEEPATEEAKKDSPATEEEGKKEEPAAAEEEKTEEPVAKPEETAATLSPAEGEKKEELAAKEVEEKQEVAKKPIELTDDQRDNVRKAFDAVDTDKSGTVEVKEFMVALKALDVKMTEDEVTAVFKKFDDNKDQKLQFDEYLQMILGALSE